MNTESSSMHAQHKSFTGSAPGQQKGRGDQGKGEKKALFCTNCKKTNHTVDRCYFINGFPRNYREGKNPNANAQKTGQGEKFAGSVQPPGGTVNSSLTSDQIAQLLSLLDTKAADKGKEKMTNDFARFAGSFYEEEAGDW